ncbi:PEP-CTERM sorting domain-containing protein [Arenibaculum pallidiluteum]|uniref:PEP-CTERM sorting domain-containing protein n=1 Tax=Arenibaculum pallidiluteum TaxID=2812559 RepID=UPI0038B22DB4
MPIHPRRGGRRLPAGLSADFTPFRPCEASTPVFPPQRMLACHLLRRPGCWRQDAVPVSEPMSLALLGTGLIGLTASTRRRQGSA